MEVVKITHNGAKVDLVMNLQEYSLGPRVAERLARSRKLLVDFWEANLFVLQPEQT